MLTNVEIVLRALQQGLEVDLGVGYPLVLAETPTGTKLCFVYAEECNPICDVHVGAFIDWCNNLSTEQIAQLALRNVVSKMRQTRST